MPIRLKDTMPVVDRLEQENIFVMTRERAIHQDIRELKIGIVNLMPNKETTELQLLRMLSNSPLQLEITFIQMATHRYKYTAASYLDAYYRRFDEVEQERFDGLIITGAPVEQLEFEQVDYWRELCRVMDWSRTHVTSSLHICWAAQAGLYYHYGVGKYPLEKKLSGVYLHRLEAPSHTLVRGFDDEFYAPHSRYTGVCTPALEAQDSLRVLARSEAAGPYLISSRDGSQVFVLGHPEYDAETLGQEYQRDLGLHREPALPENYFEGDDPQGRPRMRWRSHGNLLFSNWLNYFVYQVTPYDLEHL